MRVSNLQILQVNCEDEVIMFQTIKYVFLPSLICRCTGQLVFFLTLFLCLCCTKLNDLYKAFIPTQSDCGTCMFDKTKYTPSLTTSDGCSSIHHTISKSTMLVPSSQGGGPDLRTCYLQVDWLRLFIDSRPPDLNCPIMLISRAATRNETYWTALDSRKSLHSHSKM